MNRGVVAMGAVALSALGLVACAPSADDLTPPDRDRSAQAGEDPELTERLHLPIYDYRTDMAQMGLIQQATDIHVEECMRELGYDYTSSGPSGEHEEEDTAFFGPNGEYRRYGNVSAESAEKYGFGVPDHLDGGEAGEGVEEPETAPWTINHSGQTEQDALDSLFGDRAGILTPSGQPVPEFGCVGWAQQQVDPNTVFVTKEEAQSGVAGEQSGIAETAEWIKRTSFEEMLDTSEVIDVIDAWGRCMAEAGYPGEDFWLVGSSESLVAVDDTEAALVSVACKEETGAIDLMVETEREIQVRLISQNESELLERYEQLEAVVDRALDSVTADS